MKEIIIKSKVYGDKVMLVDDCYLDLASSRKWCLQKTNQTFYAQRQIKGIKKYIHRLIMNEPKGFIDHINGNGLDNRKTNLRIVNAEQNARNSNKPNTNSTGYKGVCKCKNGKYTVGLSINNKRIHIGLFTNIEMAAKAYNEAAKKYYGEYAKLNVINSCAE
jgi:hypothetical protein